MRKFHLLLHFMLILLIFSACSAPSPHTNNSTPPTATGSDVSVPSGNSQIGTNITIKDLTPHLELLNSRFFELFGAEIDGTQSFYRVYASADAYYRGDAPVAIKPSISGEPILWEDSYDPLVLDLYQITNFHSIDEWTEYLGNYLSPEIITNWENALSFDETFFEHDGILYLTRGARGYGSSSLNLDAAKLLSVEKDSCSVTVDCYYFDSFECTYQVDFEFIDGKWILTGYQEYVDDSQLSSTPIPVNSEDTHPLLKELRDSSLSYNSITAFSNGTAWLDYRISYYPLDESGNSTTHAREFAVCFDKNGTALYQYEYSQLLGTSGGFSYLRYHKAPDKLSEKNSSGTEQYVLVLNSNGDLVYSVPYSYDNDSIEGYYNGYLFVRRGSYSDPVYFDIFDPTGNLVNTLSDSDFQAINSDMVTRFKLTDTHFYHRGHGVFYLQTDYRKDCQLLYLLENHCLKAIRSEAKLVFRADYALADVYSDGVLLLNTSGEEFYAPVPSSWISSVGQYNLLWDGWLYNDSLFHPSGYSYNISDGQPHELAENYRNCLPDDHSYVASDGTIAVGFMSSDGSNYVTVFNMESWEPISKDIPGRLFAYLDEILFIRNEATNDIEVYTLDGQMLYSFMENGLELEPYKFSVGDGVIEGENWNNSHVLPYFDFDTGKRLFEQIDFSSVVTREFSPN